MTTVTDTVTVVQYLSCVSLVSFGSVIVACHMTVIQHITQLNCFDFNEIIAGVTIELLLFYALCADAIVLFCNKFCYIFFLSAKQGALCQRVNHRFHVLVTIRTRKHVSTSRQVELVVANCKKGERKQNS